MNSSVQRRQFLVGSLSSLGYLSLAGCGGSDSSNTSQVAQIATTELPQMFTITSATKASIVSRPETFLASYLSLGSGSSTPLQYVQSQMGAQFSTLTNTGALAVYASVIAFNAAPFAATPLDAMNSTLSQLLNAESLVCGHYCKLTTLLSLLGNPQLIPPDAAAGAPEKPDLHFLVWLDTVPLNTGYHSQLVITGVLDNAYLLLDPSYGYALRIPFPSDGPNPNITTVENAATMLATPIDASNLAVLDPNRTSATPDMLKVIIGGQLGPQYIYHDSIYGCEGWDTRISQIIDNFG